MNSFILQVKNYRDNHQNPITSYAHIGSVFLLALSIMILLGFVRIVIIDVVSFNLAHIAVFALILVYLRLYWILALALAPALILMLWIAHFFSGSGPTSFALSSFLLLFVLGIGLHAVGYIVEGNRPPLLEIIKQLIYAPLILIAEMFFQFGYLTKLQDEILGKGEKDHHSRTGSEHDKS